MQISRCHEATYSFGIRQVYLPQKVAGMVAFNAFFWMNDSRMESLAEPSLGMSSLNLIEVKKTSLGFDRG